MNIGEAARRSRLPTKTIRYYENVDLISSTRRPNGFREYDERGVAKLRFIGCARSLGFTIQECRQLVDLFESRKRPVLETAALAREQIDAIHHKIALLRRIEAALVRVAKRQGSSDANFPVLDIEGQEAGA